MKPPHHGSTLTLGAVHHHSDSKNPFLGRCTSSSESTILRLNVQNGATCGSDNGKKSNLRWQAGDDQWHSP